MSIKNTRGYTRRDVLLAAVRRGQFPSVVVNARESVRGYIGSYRDIDIEKALEIAHRRGHTEIISTIWLMTGKRYTYPALIIHRGHYHLLDYVLAERGYITGNDAMYLNDDRVLNYILDTRPELLTAEMLTKYVHSGMTAERLARIKSAGVRLNEFQLFQVAVLGQNREVSDYLYSIMVLPDVLDVMRLTLKGGYRCLRDNYPKIALDPLEIIREGAFYFAPDSTRSEIVKDCVEMYGLTTTIRRMRPEILTRHQRAEWLSQIVSEVPAGDDKTLPDVPISEPNLSMLFTAGALPHPESEYQKKIHAQVHRRV